MAYERPDQPLAHPRVFLRRLGGVVVVGAVLIVGSLAIGMVGFHTLEDRAWLDAFLDASMLLSGMGPVSVPHTDAGKLFAGAYALFSGFAVLAISGVMLAPVFHRMLHAFHLEDTSDA